MSDKRISDLEEIARKQLVLAETQAEAVNLMIAQIQALTIIAVKAVHKLSDYERRVIRAEALESISRLPLADLSSQAVEAIMSGGIETDTPLTSMAATMLQ